MPTIQLKKKEEEENLQCNAMMMPASWNEKNEANDNKATSFVRTVCRTVRMETLPYHLLQAPMQRFNWTRRLPWPSGSSTYCDTYITLLKKKSMLLLDALCMPRFLKIEVHSFFLYCIIIIFCIFYSLFTMLYHISYYSTSFNLFVCYYYYWNYIYNNWW